MGLVTEYLMKRSIWRILVPVLAAEVGLICGFLTIKGRPPSGAQVLIWGVIILAATSVGTIARNRRRNS